MLKLGRKYRQKIIIWETFCTFIAYKFCFLNTYTLTILKNMNETIFNNIKNFIEEFRWIYSFELRRDTRLENNKR